MIRDQIRQVVYVVICRVPSQRRRRSNMQVWWLKIKLICLVRNVFSSIQSYRKITYEATSRKYWYESSKVCWEHQLQWRLQKLFARKVKDGIWFVHERWLICQIPNHDGLTKPSFWAFQKDFVTFLTNNDGELQFEMIDRFHEKEKQMKNDEYYWTNMSCYSTVFYAYIIKKLI